MIGDTSPRRDCPRRKNFLAWLPAFRILCAGLGTLECGSVAMTFAQSRRDRLRRKVESLASIIADYQQQRARLDGRADRAGSLGVAKSQRG